MSDIAKPQKLYNYNENQSLDKDVRQLYDWATRLQYTETNPSGNRVGKYLGEALLYKTGSNYYVKVCTGSGTTNWLGVQLTAVP